MKALGEKIIVSRSETKQASPGGIILPDSAKESPAEGLVVATGTKATGIGIGDLVMFRKFAGTEVTVDGEKYVVLHVDDILVVR